MKRHSQQVKDKALALWKSGKELEEISKELDISFGTLRTWHNRGSWSKKRKIQKQQNDEQLTQKIAEADAKEKFDVRQEMINNLNDARKIRDSEAEKPIEKASLLNVEHKYLEHIGKIDQLYVEKHEHSGRVQVTPIFGDMKLNVHSNDSNEKDT